MNIIIDRLGALTKGSCRGRRPPDSKWNDPMHLDRFGPNFSPTWPIGANLGSSWVQDSAPVGSKIVQLGLGQVRPFAGSAGQVGPNPSQFCGLNATRWKLAFFLTAIFNGFMRGHVAHIGPVSGPTSALDAPTQDQVAHAKLRHVGPHAVGLKFGLSWS